MFGVLYCITTVDTWDLLFSPLKMLTLTPGIGGVNTKTDTKIRGPSHFSSMPSVAQTMGKNLNHRGSAFFTQIGQ